MDPSISEPAVSVVTGKIGAGVGIRFVAFLIDCVICLAAFFIYAAIVGLVSGTGYTGNIQGASAIIFFLLVTAYIVGFEWKRGATIGKQVMHFHVEKVDGSSDYSSSPPHDS